MQELLVHGLTIAFAAGGAFIGVRIRMNGMKSDIGELKEDVRHVRSDCVHLKERMARVETKLDMG